jgi:hypothetical protein
MKMISELFARPINRRIEEVIKVTQADEVTVQNELQEYIATDSIKGHYETLYDEIIQVARNPREGIGVWVSGFFGSGKSSFAKILGYTVAAKPVLGRTASQIFKENIKDIKINGLLDVINSTVPTEAVIFDVSMDRGVRTASERITEIMYKALLRELDYPEDFDLAELEIALEGDGRLESFTRIFEELHDKPWQKRRKLGLAINEASAALNHLDPKTYSQPDSYAKSIGSGRANISPGELAERAFVLATRRRAGKALIFIIDEVGQYVSRSVEKMLDLQSIVEAFGIQGKNRAKTGQAVAPFWIVVTSQEKLNEIVDSLDSKKIELARLQDRFRLTIDLKQTDIPEIAGKRVLDKTDDAKTYLSQLFEDNEGRLNTFCVLERTERRTSVTRDAFVNLYPYLPYQIDLCIDIVSGLRLKRGAHRHIGGSNRTIIKQAQEMMINPQTQLAMAPIGTLVTLDKVYELLYLGNLLPSETTREIDSVSKQLSGNDMALKVAKAIALLESVKNLPRSIKNIATVLHPNVTADSIEKQVKAAVTDLERIQVIRESDEGYKLLTVQEKKWDIDRLNIDAKQVDRNRIVREICKDIFSDPKLRNYSFQNLKTFRTRLTIDAIAVETDGQIQLNLAFAQDVESLPLLLEEIRQSSVTQQEELFWSAAFSDQIHQMVLETHRSREMVSTHERMAAQGKLTPEEASCLAEEKVRRDRNQRQLRASMGEVLQSGIGFFRGVRKDASTLGSSLPEIFHGFLNDAVPNLYPKLAMGIRPLSGNEAEKFLSAANLTALPSVFYEADDGLGLVIKQGGKWVVNLSADICKEILTYLVKEHKYGNKVTGKMLEARFQGIGYGWDRDVVQLVLAVLLRGGAVEITHQGRKYRNPNDPACRQPFSKVPAFRAASFAPREAIDLRTLRNAADHYEEITGKEIDIEEGAIAVAFKRLAAEDWTRLLLLVAEMKANNLPGVDLMEAHQQYLSGIQDMPNDDCVRTLAGEGKSYLETRRRIGLLEAATTEANLAILRKAKHAYSVLWDALKKNGPIAEELGPEVDELITNLSSGTFFEHIEAIRLTAEKIRNHYAGIYKAKHEIRAKLYVQRLEMIKGMQEWALIDEDTTIDNEEKQSILAPLTDRSKNELALSEQDGLCANCRSSLAQLETDIELVDAIKAQVIKVIQDMTAAPDETIERVRVADVLRGKLEKPEDVEEAITQLRDHLLKLLAKGAKIILE